MEENIAAAKRRLVNEQIRGLALDIDETLSWTIGYWVARLQRKFGNPENLSPYDVIVKYRYTQNVPYWQTEEALAWMDEHRNSNEIQELLPLIEHADTSVQKINRIIPIVCYLTTRPVGVVKGTKKWLQKHNFPEAEIIARPPGVHLTEGNAWKAEVLEYLYPNVVGIIDDNPGLVSHISKGYRGTIYLYDNIETSRKDIAIIPCKRWEDVLKGIQNNI